MNILLTVINISLIFPIIFTFSKNFHEQKTEYIYKWIGGGFHYTHFQGCYKISSTCHELYPHNRESFGGTKISPKKFLIFGGFGYAVHGTGYVFFGGNFWDLWEYNLQTGNFSLLGPESNRGVIEYNQEGRYGIKHEYSSLNWPGCRKFLRIRKIKNESIVLYGGHGWLPVTFGVNYGNLNDLWIYSLIEGKWKWEAGLSIKNPSQNIGVYGVYGVNTYPGSGNGEIETIQENSLLLYVGKQIWIYNFTISMWKLNLRSLNGDFGEYGSKKHFDGSNWPGDRGFTSMVKISKTRVGIFGGQGYDIDGQSGNLNDFFIYDIELNLWNYAGGGTKSNTFGNYIDKGYYNSYSQPGGKYSPMLIPYFTQDQGCFIYGGRLGPNEDVSGAEFTSNDLWLFNYTTYQFKWIRGVINRTTYPTYGKKNEYDGFVNEPGDRILAEQSGFTFIMNNENVVIFFGGKNYYKSPEDKGPKNDLWLWKEAFSCNDIMELNENVCGGVGKCINHEICDCYVNYQISTYCNVTSCNGIRSDSSNVCNNHGTCTSYDNCQCSPNYIDKWCDVFTCKGVSQFNEFVCSTNGICQDVDECKCFLGYYGNDCENENIVGRVLREFWYFFEIVIPLIIVGIVFVIVLVFLIILTVRYTQKKKMKKFLNLKDIDIILAEQKASNFLIPIKFNKEFFVAEQKDVELLKIIGEGGSLSVVYKIKYQDEIAALKMYNTRLISEKEDFEMFERELEIICNISHQNVLGFYAALLNFPRFGIICEFCSRGDLENFLIVYKHENGKSYPIKEKLRLAGEICSAMDWIHSKQIYHRDLKPQNVLITEKYVSKVMDFGVSKIVTNFDDTKTSRVGTSAFISPEIILGKGKYTNLSDVYSFAILLYTLITEDFKYKDIIGIEMKAAVNNFRPRINKKHFVGCDWIIGIIKKCWDSNPDVRMDFGSLFKVFKKYVDRSRTDINNIPSSRDKNIQSKLYFERKAFLEKVNKDITEKDIILKKKKKELAMLIGNKKN